MWYVLAFVIGVLAGVALCVVARVTGRTRALREQLEEELRKLHDEVVKNLDGDAQAAALNFLTKVKFLLRKIL